MICNMCPRKCNADRNRSSGFCKSPEKFRLARAALHFWEEPCISGKNGSGTIFFSGCNLKCVYCQNYEISICGKGIQVDETRLKQIVDKLIADGAENINFVSPTHYALMLARYLKKNKPSVPVVYNSSGYESVETLKALEGLVDIYLVDFKYIRNDKSLRYSSAADYPETAIKAISEMRRQVSDEFNGSLMKKGLIIRHLILPANTNSSIEILDCIKENFSDTYVSLMSQYIPCANLDGYDEINRKITKREYDKVVNYAISGGFEKLFIQELSSADKKYIPKFDFTGIM